MSERDFWKELDAVPGGVEQVRKFLGQSIWSEEKVKLAGQWLAHQTSKGTSEANAAILDEARAANRLAEEANASALDANAIAREASRFAKRSVKAAWTANIIATASAALAAAAIVISIIGVRHP